MTSPSICIIIPYFGRWPFWMPCFLAGCRANPDVDWLLYSDCGEPVDCPANVQVVTIGFADYCSRISQSLQIDFHPDNPYKLCDIKPALGWMHAEELAAYDFWGFGDIDLIYGDLRSYFTAERLAKHDLFSTHARRISGHFCLVRNSEDMRAAFMRVKSWQLKFETSEHFAFDESAFSKVFLRHKNSPLWVRKLAALFDPWLKRAEFAEAYTTPNGKIPWVDGSRNYPSKWYWQEGRLSNDLVGDRVFPYFHFMVWKNFWAESKEIIIPDITNQRLVFTKTGIEIGS